MRIRDYYDRVARERTPNYQQSSRWMDALVHRPNERFLRRLVHDTLRQAESIADLGCGTGEHLIGPLPNLKRLFLNDLSPEMLDETTARVSRAHPGVEIESHCGGIETIPRETRPAEVALCLGVLNHFETERLPEALAKVGRLASRTLLLYYAHEGFLLAGKVGVSFRRKGIHYRAIERAHVTRCLAGSGLEQVRRSYAQKLSMLSPLVVQEFRRAAAGAG